MRTTFQLWWAMKERDGFRYGDDAIAQVRMGFEGAQEFLGDSETLAAKARRYAESYASQVHQGAQLERIAYALEGMLAFAQATKAQADKEHAEQMAQIEKMQREAGGHKSS